MDEIDLQYLASAINSANQHSIAPLIVFSLSFFTIAYLAFFLSTHRSNNQYQLQFLHQTINQPRCAREQRPSFSSSRFTARSLPRPSNTIQSPPLPHMSDPTLLQRRPTTSTTTLPTQHIPPLKPKSFIVSPPSLTVIIFNVVLITILILFVIFFPNDDKFALLWKNDPKVTPPAVPVDQTQPDTTPTSPVTHPDGRQASHDPNKTDPIPDAKDPASPVTRPDCPRMCPMVYSPVCASNGITFGNTCQLAAFNECDRKEGAPFLTVVSEGECPQRIPSLGLRNAHKLPDPAPHLDTI